MSNSAIKTEQLKARFNLQNRFQLKINPQSFEYKYYQNTISEMIEKKEISLIEKIKKSLVFKFNHCYGNDFSLKIRCPNQCTFCKNLQYQKEVFNNNQTQKKQDKFLKTRLKTVSKFQQIIKIMFNK